MSTSQSLNNSFELKNCKRSLELYLRALWDKGFYLKHAIQEPHSSNYLIENEIFLPEKILSSNASISFYRAAAVHASLHAIYSSVKFEVAELNLMQRTVIGLVEDLRIELLALRNFPGLRSLWLGFHPAQEANNSALNLMMRLSRSVLDPEYIDASKWVEKGRQFILFNEELLFDANLSKTIGLSLANDLGQMRMPMNSGKYEQSISYRDDNRCLWLEKKDSVARQASAEMNDRLDIRQKKLKESMQGIQLNFTEEISSESDGFVINEKDMANLEYNKSISDNLEINVTYPEWDYRSHVLKENWCSLVQLTATENSEGDVDALLDKHKITLNRLRHIAQIIQQQQRQRKKRLEEGDELDLESVIGSMVSMRSGEEPDTRVFMRDEYHHIKSLSISVLMDLSESTNQKIDSTNITVVDLIRDAVLLLGETLAITGEEYAIAGFSSNGRHQVKFTQYKDFSDDFKTCRNKLASVKGEFSTRLGAAIRHAGEGLQKQQSMKKLLLVITDGVPSDIDVYDEQYLVQDSWHAVKALDNKNIKTFCINLNPGPSSAIDHIFGKGRYAILDDVVRLPEVLSDIYIRYARH